MAIQEVDDGAINLERDALAETTSAKHELSFRRLSFDASRRPKGGKRTF